MCVIYVLVTIEREEYDWAFMPNYYISSSSLNQESISGINQTECLLSCVRLERFRCRSAVLYYSGQSVVCYLYEGDRSNGHTYIRHRSNSDYWEAILIGKK